MYSQAFWFVHPVKCSVENVLKDCSSYHEGTEINSLTISKSFKHLFCLGVQQLWWQSFNYYLFYYYCQSALASGIRAIRFTEVGQTELSTTGIWPAVPPPRGLWGFSCSPFQTCGPACIGSWHPLFKKNLPLLVGGQGIQPSCCGSSYKAFVKYKMESVSLASPLPSPESNWLNPSVFSECCMARCSAHWRFTACSTTWNDSSSLTSTVILVRQCACPFCMCTLLCSSLWSSLLLPERLLRVTLCFP